MQSSNHKNMPSTAGIEFDIFEDNSTPRSVKDIIISAHDRLIARGKEVLALALWNCYERAQVDATVANLLWAILRERTTPQDRTTFRNTFMTPASRVIAERKRITLVESNANVANGLSLVCNGFFSAYLILVYRPLFRMRM